MRAMILAAGRGERMRPLSDRTPKPLLEVAGKPLIVGVLEALVEAGFEHVVVNHAWLGAQIESALGDGSRYGARLRYSPEPPGALDSGGGIFSVLEWLGPGPFVVVNADLWTDFDYGRLRQFPGGGNGNRSDLAHLVMVDNPSFHSQGDFCLRDGRLCHPDTAKQGPAGKPLTFAGIGVYRPQLFELRTGQGLGEANQSGGRQPRFSVVPLLVEAMRQGRVSGERFRGEWENIGTPEQLDALSTRVAATRGKQAMGIQKQSS